MQIKKLEMFNYINTGFFNFIASTIATDNEAFDYGEGGDKFYKGSK